MITYCTNIHPGESWDDVFGNLNSHLLKVKAAVSPDDPFPVGLRLSNLASLDLDKDASSHFQDWCDGNDCFVSTINGFPYGSFHSRVVKENVYMPDWRYGERVEYTKRLAVLLDRWLPAAMTGSISTVPLGFKGNLSEGDHTFIRQNLMDILEFIDRLKQKSGKNIILSLEPEPGCLLETTGDVVNFFERMNFPHDLGDSIGICFDCCHMALQFEDPSESLPLLERAGIKIGKFQISSALRLNGTELQALRSFDEPCYLHQVVIRRDDGSFFRYNDISDALNAHVKSAGEEWRIHYHIPVFVEKTDTFETTQYFINRVIANIKDPVLLEVETYTWDILPAELQSDTVTDSIVREINWVREKADEKNRSN